MFHIFSQFVDACFQVFSDDIFTSKFCDDIFNHYAGMQFRNEVLAPGGSKDPMEILSEYLGGEPSIKALISSRVEFMQFANNRPI
jgi:thimet oligopeptidase